MKSMKKQIWLLLLAAAILLILLPLQAYAETTTVSYIDENGEPKSETATVVDSKTWSDDWYVVTDDNMYLPYVDVFGDVKLILADGCMLETTDIILWYGASLTIYGQEQGTGQLVAESYDAVNPAIGGKGSGNPTITINGGTIKAYAWLRGAGIGIADESSSNVTIIINDGTVEASSHYGAGIGTGANGTGSVNVTINGGSVKATSHAGAGIGFGYYNSSGNASITIDGGTVIATSTDGAGIGKGQGSSSNVTTIIDGGLVTAFTIDPAPENSSGQPISSTKITLENVKAATPISSLTIDETTYNPANLSTNANGEFRLWLTTGAEVTRVEAGGQVYQGSVTVGGEGSLDDKSAPTVNNLTPSGSDVGRSGNIVIQFSEEMDSTPGTVSLDNGIIQIDLSPSDGSWDLQKETYTILYTGLDYVTTYTITISGFQDLAGNVMDPDTGYDFTTIIQPLIPTVWPASLTMDKGGTGSLSIDFGQGLSAATSAAITVADDTIAAVSSPSLASTGTITVTGLRKGTTEITVSFNDPAPTIVEIPVTVNPVAPVWPSGSSLTASDITRTGVSLTWTPAQDLTAVTGYRIYQDGSLLAEVADDVTSYNVSGLAASRSYSFQVQAGNTDDQWTANGPTVSIKTKSKRSNSGSENNTKTEEGKKEPKPSNITIQQGQNFTNPVLAVIALTPASDDQGNYAVTVSDEQIAEAIALARQAAQDQGIGITLNINLPENAQGVSLQLSRETLQKLVDAEVKVMQINGAPISTTLDLAALKGILTQVAGNVTITISPVPNLSGEAAQLIGSRPAYDITISSTKDGQAVNITDLGQGIASIFISYVPDQEEAVNYLFGVYVDENGQAQRLNGSLYDSDRGGLLILTNHFSVYGVGYTAPSAKFTDVQKHWAIKSIDYVAGRGLLPGHLGDKLLPRYPYHQGHAGNGAGQIGRNRCQQLQSRQLFRCAR